MTILNSDKKINENNESRKFLNEIFGNKPDGTFINICVIKNEITKSNWFQDIEKAAVFVESLYKNPVDVYLQCGFTNSDLGPHRRGKKVDIAGVMALFMDIDFKSAKKPKCPPGLQEALSLVNDHGTDPSIINHSGNGVHSWWCLKEPLIFENGDFQTFEMANRRMQETIKFRASERGWSGLDSTFDCTRLLRIPGTFNCKEDTNLRPVKIVSNNGRRYGDLSEFDEFLIPEDQIQKSEIVTMEDRSKISQGLVLNPNAEPPADMLDDFLETDLRFKDTWQRKRTKKDLKDQSASGYTMSLVDFLVEAGLEDQIIADFVISFYRRHGEDMEKAIRPDYIPRTIVKARKFYAEKNADETIETANLLRGHPSDISKKQAITAVSQKLGIKIKSIKKYTQDNPEYLIQTDQGDIRLPSVEELIRPSRLQSFIAAKLGFYIRYNTRTWPHIAQLLLDICEEVEMGPEGKITENIPLWIREYLIGRETDSFYRIVKSNYPHFDQSFHKDGFFYIRLGYFLRYLEVASQIFNLTPKKLAVDMRICGCESVPFPNLVIYGKKTTRCFWKIPHSISIPEVEDDEEDEEEYKPQFEDLSDEFKDEHAMHARRKRNESELEIFYGD
jgi:hypothetical protein